VLKRGALFAPIFFATVMLLGRGRLTPTGAIVQTVLLLAIFIPFSYFMDRLVWRSHEKRLQKAKPAGR
jgi:glycopeptide antibiotics resistance protein